MSEEEKREHERNLEINRQIEEMKQKEIFLHKLGVFDIIARQMKRRVSVLYALDTTSGLGIEGWFRIEIYHALVLNKIECKIQNKGPDLEFIHRDFSLELKATQTAPAEWIRKDGLKYPGVDCLFLGPIELKESLKPNWCREIFGDWMIGWIINEEVEVKEDE